MTQTQCPRCRARRPVSMDRCPVCDGPSGNPPRFDETEQAARREASGLLKWVMYVDAGLALVVALLIWLL